MSNSDYQILTRTLKIPQKNCTNIDRYFFSRQFDKFLPQVQNVGHVIIVRYLNFNDIQNFYPLNMYPLKFLPPSENAPIR